MAAKRILTTNAKEGIMRKSIKVFMLFVLAMGLFACATPNMKLSVPADPYMVSNKDKALVYFIRPISLGYLINAAVYDDEKFIGFVPYKQKLPYLVDEGKHTFMVVSEAADFLNADLLSGKTYYIQVVPRMGAWRARFSLAPVTKDDLGNPKVQKWLEKARLIKNKDSASKWAEDNHASVLKKKEVYFPKWQQKPEDKRPFLKAEDGQ